MIRYKKQLPKLKNKNYELTKPKIWYLLVFTAFGTAITASNIYNIEISIATWALMLFGVAAGSASANTLTNYHDRDIDEIMERTKKGRPIPSKRNFSNRKNKRLWISFGRNFNCVCIWNCIYYFILEWNVVWYIHGIWFSR